MFVAAIVCLLAAFISAAFGVWALTRPASEDVVRQARRAIAPTQLAAAVMLAAGAAVALASQPAFGWPVLITAVLGSLITIAVGVWQSAQFAVAIASTTSSCAAGRHDDSVASTASSCASHDAAAGEGQTGVCGSSCGSCVRSCE